MAALALMPLLSRALLPASCLLVIGYFGSHALVGSSGLMALDEIRAEKSELAKRNAELLAEKAALDRRIALLNPRGVDPDLADELVRRHLGVVRPDELIVPLKPEG
jgi:cell division protein FtsB